MRPRKFDEDLVLAAARSEFWHRGYEGASMSSLCEATGVRSQSLYGAFGSKHDLFVRTLGDYCDEQIAGLEAGRHEAPSPWSWLLDAVTFADGGRGELTSDGCYLSGSTSALARLDPDVGTLSQRTYARFIEIFVETVGQAQRAGEVRADLAARRIAPALLAAMQGLEFIRRYSSAEEFQVARSSTREGLVLAYAVEAGTP